MASKAQDSTSEGQAPDSGNGSGRSRSARKSSSSRASAAKSGAAASSTSRKRPSSGAKRSRRGSSGLGTASVIGAAAAGLAAGLVANFGRKVAMQAPSALAGDWFEALKGEHKAALALFDAIQTTTDRQTTRRSVLLMQLKHALGKHAFTEENVVYPALRDAGEAGDADKLNHEHGYVKQHLYDLDNMAKDASEFLPLVAKFREELERHIREEEDEIFPALHARLSVEQNLAVTRAANKEGFKIA